MSTAWCQYNVVLFSLPALCQGKERVRWHPGWDVSVRGGWDPPCHQCHSASSQGNAALTSAPAEFRRVTGCPVADAIDCHPMSDFSTLSSSKNPRRLEPALYLSFHGRSLEDWCQSKTELTARANKSSANCFTAALIQRKEDGWKHRRRTDHPGSCWLKLTAFCTGIHLREEKMYQCFQSGLLSGLVSTDRALARLHTEGSMQDSGSQAILRSICKPAAGIIHRLRVNHGKLCQLVTWGKTFTWYNVSQSKPYNVVSRRAKASW